jgi:hypothetical protein
VAANRALNHFRPLTNLVNAFFPDNASDTPSSVRFLISNASAGSIIGKGGSTISEFQLQSGARIQLSRNREFFPGTTDRIILLSGTINAILTALHLILSKIMTEVGLLNLLRVGSRPGWVCITW